MSWSSFTMTVAVIYICYYVFNIVLDLMKSKGNSSPNESNDELTFSEEVTAQEVIEPNQQAIPVQEIENITEVEEVEDVEEGNPVWERTEDDTEELNLVSFNTNQSTGGVTEIAEMFKLIKDETVDIKHSIVF